MSEIVKPQSVDTGEFKRFIVETYAANLQNLFLQRLDKGGPNDRYVMYWDDSTGTAPNTSQLQSDYSAWKALPNNDDKSLRIERARAYLQDRFHERLETRTLVSIRNSLGAEPSNAEIKAGIDSAVESLIDVLSP